jgi:hypothetical protein
MTIHAKIQEIIADIVLIMHVYKNEAQSTQPQESTELTQNAGVNMR